MFWRPPCCLANVLATLVLPGKCSGDPLVAWQNVLATLFISRSKHLPLLRCVLAVTVFLSSEVCREPGEAPRLRAEVEQLRRSLHAADVSLRNTRDENSSLKEAIRLLKADCEQLQRQASSAGGSRAPAAAAAGVSPLADGKTASSNRDATATLQSSASPSSRKGLIAGMKLGSPGGFSRFGGIGGKGKFMNKEARDPRTRSQPPN